MLKSGIFNSETKVLITKSSSPLSFHTLLLLFHFPCSEGTFLRSGKLPMNNNPVSSHGLISRFVLKSYLMRS